MMTLEGLKYLFENQALPIPPLRNAGMGLYDSIPGIEEFYDAPGNRPGGRSP